jgi:hypothetical protein
MSTAFVAMEYIAIPAHTVQEALMLLEQQRARVDLLIVNPEILGASVVTLLLQSRNRKLRVIQLVEDFRAGLKLLRTRTYAVVRKPEPREVLSAEYWLDLFVSTLC